MLSESDKMKNVKETYRIIKKYKISVDDMIRIWRETADYVESIKDVFQ